MWERFTDRARRVVVLAQEEARMHNHNYIGTEHILLGLIREGQGVAAAALVWLGINLDGVRQRVEEIIGEGVQTPSGHIPFTPRAKRVLQLSLREALQLGHNYIGTEHILLGLIREEDGVAAQLLVMLGADLKGVREQVIRLIAEGPRRPTSIPAFERALGNMAIRIGGNFFAGKAGILKKELDLTLQTLARQAKNNPVLVGRSAMTAAILAADAARYMAGIEAVTLALPGKVIYQISITELKRQGAATFDDALTQVMKAVEANNNVILYIDQLHELIAINAGAAASPAVTRFRRMLMRQEVQIIGSTTPDLYRRFFEADRLARRNFQLIYLPTLDAPDVIRLLERTRGERQVRFDLRIKDEALSAAAALALYLSHSETDATVVPWLLKGEDDQREADPDRAAIDAATALLDQAIQGKRHSDISEARSEEEAIDRQDVEIPNVAPELGKKFKGLHDRSSLDAEAIFAVASAATDITVAQLRQLTEDLTSTGIGAVPDTTVQQPYVLLNDEPVENFDGDLLGTEGTADGIASLLASSRSETPFVFAIDADWGMGKSTLLRQIESRLDRYPEIATVRFNAWTANDVSALEGLIKSVLAELDPNVIRRWARRLTNKRRTLAMAGIGFGILSRFIGVTSLVDKLWTQLAVDARSRNQLREAIRGMLTDWVNATGRASPKRTLIVFVDDLDRCADAVIVQVCEAVKLYLDAPGLIFVFACDLSVISRGASRDGSEGVGRMYLEKIVQVVHRLPPPDEGQLTELILGYARRSGTTALIDRTITRILIESAGRNPRRIKRIINSIVLENRLNPTWSLPPLSRTQLVVAILLQHLYPAFYDLLVDEAANNDPIETFLDYATIRSRLPAPPLKDDSWWKTAEQLFTQYEMSLAPAKITSDEFQSQLKTLEKKLPGSFPVLVRDAGLIALLRQGGDRNARIALRSELMRHPLSTDITG